MTRRKSGDLLLGQEKFAMGTIENYLNTHTHHLSKVVTDVFSQEDYNVYKNNAIH